MQTKFKDIAQYYLGTGLRLQDIQNNATGYLNGINPNEIYFQGCWFKADRFKPLLRSLDSLTKPITVKGYNDENSFVPIEEIGELDYDTFSLDYYKNHAIRLPFQLIQLLCSWHFNIFNLPETEYIKID